MNEAQHNIEVNMGQVRKLLTFCKDNKIHITYAHKHAMNYLSLASLTAAPGANAQEDNDNLFAEAISILNDDEPKLIEEAANDY